MVEVVVVVVAWLPRIDNEEAWTAGPTMTMCCTSYQAASKQPFSRGQAAAAAVVAAAAAATAFLSLNRRYGATSRSSYQVWKRIAAESPWPWPQLPSAKIHAVFWLLEDITGGDIPQTRILSCAISIYSKRPHMRPNDVIIGQTTT